jgi:predicted  nucleic acid-binding Zn-ribbon protein
MKKKLGLLGLSFLLLAPVCATSEFIKKPKQKKESASQVRDEVAELLESALRQLGQNIQQSIDAQNKIFDTIKEIMSDSTLSIDQLQDLRARLQKHCQNLQEQQAELYDIVLSCKKSST